MYMYMCVLDIYLTSWDDPRIPGILTIVGFGVNLHVYVGHSGIPRILSVQGSGV